MSSITTIQPKSLFEKSQSGDVELIDVRTPVEFQEVHAKLAKNIPLDQLDPQQIIESRNGSETPVYLICKSGSRSQMAAKKILSAGYDNVVSVEGGTEAWAAADLPVNRGKKAISLERQVRIVAGFLVLLGAALALLVHPWFAGLSGFIGAGLMFAGITDTCGMGMMLAKMPWNQACDSSETCSIQ